MSSYFLKIFKLQQVRSPGVCIQPFLEFARFYIKAVVDSNGWESVRVHERIRMVLADAENLAQVLLRQKPLDLDWQCLFSCSLTGHTVTSLYGRNCRNHVPYRTAHPSHRT